MDERSGVTVYDRSGKRNHGTISGATWAAGKRGAALSFDGQNDYVSFGNPTSLNPTGAITMLAWINVDAFPVGYDTLVIDKNYTQYFLAVGNSVPKNGMIIRIATSAGYITLTVNNVISTGVWKLVAVTYNGTICRAYVNGLEVGSPITLAGTINVTTNNFYIGGRATTSPFDGLIAGARIYNRALNAAEVKRLYESEIMLVRH